MGIDSNFGLAFAKATLAVYGKLPTSGKVFVSVADRDKRAIVFPVRRLVDLGFTVYATEGTGLVLKRHGIDFTPVARHSSGESVDAVSLIASGEIDLVITTPSASSGPRTDGWEIRSAAVVADVSCVTTIQGATAATQAIESASRGEIRVASLQELHQRLRGSETTAV
jgi:carbamoyl-phosphate synthase large subunit